MNDAEARWHANNENLLVMATPRKGSDLVPLRSKIEPGDERPAVT